MLHTNASTRCYSCIGLSGSSHSPARALPQVAAQQLHESIGTRFRYSRAQKQPHPHCGRRQLLVRAEGSAAPVAPWQSADARLVLQDGSVWKGKAFGATDTEIGEVVFNTSITGYEEIMTDPSYRGQFVVFTHPHIGNVGINLGKPLILCFKTLHLI